MTVESDEIRICDAKFLPIVAGYAERIGLVEAIDSQLNCKMELSLGVMKSFDLDLSHVHHDTTSHSLYGDYLLYDRKSPRPAVCHY
jgi:hypothetical protein